MQSEDKLGGEKEKGGKRTSLWVNQVSIFNFQLQFYRSPIDDLQIAEGMLLVECLPVYLDVAHNCTLKLLTSSI